jgi:choline kinase
MRGDEKREKPAMQCLIIAAGQGTRLRSVARSKPLARVGGRPLIEHVILSARAGGATRFALVTGYEAEPIEAYATELAGRLRVEIETVRNPQWERPNGVSVLAAADRLDDEFILLMSDHLFDPVILAGMIAAERRGALTLAADHKVANPELDLDDATKLALGLDGRIERIGKTLPDYDAVDTGIFIVRAPLLEALRASLAAGASGSLSEGVQAVANAGEAWTHDIGERWWLDVDDEAAFEKARRRLGDQPSAAT